ncbi:hypothetical protein MAR_002585 [Mya arenaria]|uniref:Uncharacterized protein n=1 Tax=Mya arenaria TaxID=6604 RepID=A0ABY7G3I2_MYAAR|nr:hypothetical protein MAR_002585 [Mya arenaria]
MVELADLYNEAHMGRQPSQIGQRRHLARDCPTSRHRAAMFGDNQRYDNIGRGHSYGNGRGVSRRKRRQQNSCCEARKRCSRRLFTEISEVQLQCGYMLPLLNAACNDRRTISDKGMQVCDGWIGNNVVQVLRDTGCSTVVANEVLVDSSMYTGETRSFVLIDGTVRRFAVAKLYVQTPFYKGEVEALVMKRPVYDLIIGNISGVKDIPSLWEEVEKTTKYTENDTYKAEVVDREFENEVCVLNGLVTEKETAFNDEEKVLGVQTRAHVRAERQSTKPLKIPTAVLDVSREQVIRGQRKMIP